MNQRRRTFLKQLGATTTLTAAAGCLNGGNDTNSTPDDTSTPPETEPDTPTEGDTPPENQNPGEDTETNGGQGPSTSSGVLSFVPTANELNTSAYDGDGAAQLLALGFPSSVAEMIPQETQTNYEDNGYFVPYDFADVSMPQVEQKAAVRFDGIGIVPICQFNEDIRGRALSS